MRRFSETSSIFALDNVKKRSSSARHPHFLSWQHQKQSNSARLPSKMKVQPLSGNQRPDLPTALMKMSLVLRLPRKMHLCRSSSNVPRLPSFLDMLQNPTVLLTFDKVHNPVHLPRETTSERPSGPSMWCFVHFDLETCFAPQRRAFFRHLNIKKCSEREVFLNFFTSKCASRHNGVHFFDISKSKSGPELMCFAPQCLHFFDISTSKSAPNVRCF